LWRLTAGATARSRRARFQRFWHEMRPSPSDTVLDVGVADSSERAGNFLEASYPWPERITAVAPGPVPGFRSRFPAVNVVEGDGRTLPFGAQAFDIGFANAVVEHVGGPEAQRSFVTELLRTSRRVFVATPNRWFPIDPHTLLPFVHWLPRRARWAALRALGQARWASDEALHPLDARAFLALFPDEAQPRLIRQRMLGITSVLIVVADGTYHRDA
jgi:hypothetical protein